MFDLKNSGWHVGEGLWAERTKAHWVRRHEILLGEQVVSIPREFSARRSIVRDGGWGALCEVVVTPAAPSYLGEIVTYAQVMLICCVWEASPTLLFCQAGTHFIHVRRWQAAAALSGSQGWEVGA